MKIVSRFLFLLPVLFCGFTAQAEVPAASPAPDASAAPAASATPATDTIQPQASASQAIDPAKAAEIRKMLELTGTVKMLNMMIAQMVTSFRVRNSGVSDDFWDRFQKELNAQDLIEKIVPLYDKYYTLDDLKAVNAFYASPAGQRMVASAPQIMQESMQIGQTWGRGMGMKIEAEIEKEKKKEAAAAAAAAPPAATSPAATTTPTSATPAAPTPAPDVK